MSGPPLSRASSETAAARFPPGAVPADDQPVRVGVEYLGPRGRPLDDGVTVPEPRRELVLGREPVVRRDDDAVQFVRQHPTDRVVRLHVAEEEPAAVHPDEHRERPVPLRRVDPYRHATVRPRDDAVLHVRDRRDVPVDREVVGVSLPGLLDGEGV